MATPSRPSARKPEPFIPAWGWWILGPVFALILIFFLKISGVGAGIGNVLSDITSFLKAAFWPVLLFFGYFIPFYIGSASKRATAIFVANLIFGWTVIGWFIVLIWALAERGSLPQESTKS